MLFGCMRMSVCMLVSFSKYTLVHLEGESMLVSPSLQQGDVKENGRGVLKPIWGY